MDPHATYPPPTAKKTSPWIYVGCACGGLVVLALAAVMAMTWWGFHKAKDMAEGFEDPEKRAERARAVLPYDTLPAGYEPLGSFSIPLLVDMAFFSTEPIEEPTAEPEPAGTEPAGTEPAVPDPSPGRETDVDLDFGERGFIYLVMRRLGERAELERYLRGEGPAPDWMGKGNVSVDSDEVIRNGRLDAGGAGLTYSARRGEVTTDGESRDGLFTLFLATCPDDSKVRLGIWFAPDPERGKPVAEVDWTGTPADPAALQGFAGHFRFCDGPS